MGKNIINGSVKTDKLLTIRAAENVVRLLPPLTVKKKNIDQAVAILKKVCKTYR